MLSLIVHELGHFIVYTVLFLVVNFLYNNHFKSKYYLTGLFVTIFIDLDHFIDYFLYHGLTFNLWGFIDGDNFGLSQKAYVLFHDWEVVIALLIFHLFTAWKRSKPAAFILMIILGMTAHITYDTIVYDIDWTGYFFYKRLIEGFSISAL